jgi:1,2-diacylglycerol 3-beta-galactosyltransferase
VASDQPRVSILTANAGGGHLSAARSLADALAGTARVSFLRLMDDHSPFPINTFSASYRPMVTYTPTLYRLVYRLGASRGRVLFAQRAVYPLVRRRLTTALAAERPDLWISVHPLHIEMPLWIMRESDCRVPFVTVVTDPVTPPVAWFSPDVDLCVVATESARAVALACGIPDERVRVIGLPIRRAFTEMNSHPKSEVRAQLGLPPDRPAVMLTGGGAGIGRLLPNAQAIARRLAAQDVSAQLIIVTGHNRELQRRLRAESWPITVTIRGYVDNMAEWLAAADILISKAGPGTLAEAASLGVPVIIADFVPGQEEGNVAWTLQHGAGVFERNPDQIAALVADWLLPGNPTLRRMSAQARAIARPNAASEIVTAALRLLEQRSCP